MSALSASRLGDIAPSLELPHLKYNPSVSVGVVNLAFRGTGLVKERGFGYLVPQSERDIHHTLGVLFDNDAMPGLDSATGYTKLTVMMGGHYWASPSREIPDRETLIRHARDVVRRHLGIIDEPAHAFASVQRSAIPQYRRGHLGRMRDLDDALLDRARGLSVIGPSYRGVGVNDCVLAATQVATALAEGKSPTGLEGNH